MTPAQLDAANVDQDWLEPLNQAIAEFGITQEALFLAQLAHESQGFKRLEENLHYSAVGLMATFPRYFDQGQAVAYANSPEAIANRVYANRMGNGDEASGDGWKYRGAGLIQLTGAKNQGDCAARFSIPLDGIGYWLRTKEGACRSAAWFWKAHGCDIDDLESVTRRINGGLIGLDDRRALYQKIKAATID